MILKPETHSSAEVDINSSAIAREDEDRINPESLRTSLVHAPHASCDDVWLSWPAMQERAIASGTFVVFDVITSVGNLFLIFDTLMKVWAPRS